MLAAKGCSRFSSLPAFPCITVHSFFSAGRWTALKTARGRRRLWPSLSAPAQIVPFINQPVPQHLTQVLQRHLSSKHHKFQRTGFKKIPAAALWRTLTSAVRCACVADMLQISTAELAAKAEETRGQLRHLDQQVGHSVLREETGSKDLLTDSHTHQPILHPSADVVLNVTELGES